MKEGKVEIFVCHETGLPMTTHKATMIKEQDEHKNQVVMNMIMDDWRRMVKELRIQEVMISPPVVEMLLLTW